MLVKVPQLAGRIDQQTIDLTGLKLGWSGDAVAIDEFDAACLQFPAHLAAALEVAWHQHQEQVRKARPEAEKLLRQDGLFAGVSAAAQEDGRAGRHAQLVQHARHIHQPAFIQFGRVVLQAADNLDGLRPAAQYPANGPHQLRFGPRPQPASAKSGRNSRPNRL